MKARLVPICFAEDRDEDFHLQLTRLKDLLADDAGFLDPVPLGKSLPDADGVIFPQFLGAAYRMVDAFKAIEIPIFVITSDFGTVLTWDWEICGVLRSQGINTFAPHSLDQTQKLSKTLSVKRELMPARLPVCQDKTIC